MISREHDSPRAPHFLSTPLMMIIVEMIFKTLMIVKTLIIVETLIIVKTLMIVMAMINDDRCFNN